MRRMKRFFHLGPRASTVSIRSKEGEGTEVTCRIPSAEVPAIVAAE